MTRKQYHSEFHPVASADGAKGSAAFSTGFNSNLVTIYKRSATEPSLPAEDAIYTFATGGLDLGLNTEGWSDTPPSGSDPLWVTSATASGSGATDTIDIGEWTDPPIILVPGDTLNSAVVFLFQKSNSQSVPDRPSGPLTYTFSTGLLTEESGQAGNLNGWSQDVSTAGSGAYLYVTTAAAVSTSDTDIINSGSEVSYSGDWADVTTLAQDGNNNATIYIYQRAASTPSLPSATCTYTFSTKSLTGLDNGWDTSVSDGSDPLWVSKAVAQSPTDTDSILTGDWDSPAIMSKDALGVKAELTKTSIHLGVNSDGSFDYTGASGQFIVSLDDGTDVSSYFTLSTSSNDAGLTVNYVDQTYTITGGYDAVDGTARLRIKGTGTGIYTGVNVFLTVSVNADYGTLLFQNAGARNNKAITAVPVISVTPYVSKTYDSGNVDISLGIQYTGYVADATNANFFDYYERIVYVNESNAVYAWDSSEPEKEDRQVVFNALLSESPYPVWTTVAARDVAANKWYSFSYANVRGVDADISPNRTIIGTAVTTSPFQPATSQTFNGKVGTKDASDVDDIVGKVQDDSTSNDLTPNVSLSGVTITNSGVEDPTTRLDISWTATNSNTPSSAAYIDGFKIGLYEASTSAAFTYNPATHDSQMQWHMQGPGHIRSDFFTGKDTTKYYWAVVKPVRVVRTDITASRLLEGSAVQTATYHRPTAAKKIINAPLSDVVSGADRALNTLTSGYMVGTNKVETLSVIQGDITETVFASTATNYNITSLTMADIISVYYSPDDAGDQIIEFTTSIATSTTSVAELFIPRIQLQWRMSGQTTLTSDTMEMRNYNPVTYNTEAHNMTIVWYLSGRPAGPQDLYLRASLGGTITGSVQTWSPLNFKISVLKR